MLFCCIQDHTPTKEEPEDDVTFLKTRYKEHLAREEAQSKAQQYSTR